MTQNTSDGGPDAAVPGKTGESELEMRARIFATEKHLGQLRKYTYEPYINHPAAVADLVRSVPHDQQMLAAAWLHDVVEDCGVQHYQIWNTFGSEISFMVTFLTDISSYSNKKDENRERRKELDRNWTAKAHPTVKTIKLADLINNSESIMQYDPNFARVYLREKRLLLGVLTEGDPTLWSRADEICKKAGY